MVLAVHPDSWPVGPGLLQVWVLSVAVSPVPVLVSLVAVADLACYWTWILEVTKSKETAIGVLTIPKVLYRPRARLDVEFVVPIFKVHGKLHPLAARWLRVSKFSNQRQGLQTKLWMILCVGAEA